MTEAVQRGSSVAANVGAWQLLLLPAVLAYRPPAFGNAGVNLQYFLIPVAALLGARFGLTGVISVAVGGLAFVVSISGGWGSIGGNPSLYLIALAVATMAASQHEPSAWPQWPRTARSVAVMTMAAPALLVLSLFVGTEQRPADGVKLAFGFALSLLGHFLIFVLAARGAKLWHLLAGLGVVALVSWLLAYVGLFPGERSNLMLDLVPLGLGAVLTAMVFFSVGTTFTAAPDRPLAWGWWRWPYWSAVVLLLIWLGPLDLAPFPTELSPRLRLNLFRSPALLPIVAFMLGALRGTRGVWIATALTAALVIAGAIGRTASFPYFATWFVQVEAPFLAYAYGRLGAHLTHSWVDAGIASWRRRVPRMLTAWALAIATTAAIAGEGGAVRVTLAVVFAVLFCVAYFLGRRIRRATAGTEREVTPHGWLSFLILVCVLLLVVLHLPEVAQEGTSMAGGIVGGVVLLYSLFRESLEAGRSAAQPADGLALAYLGAALLALFIVVSACRKAWRDSRKVWRDIRIMYRYGRLVLSSGKKATPT